MFLNDIEFGWIGKIPNHWELKRIKHLFHIKKELSEKPEGEFVLSLTFGGIIKRDISTNEGQLPETYKGYTKINPNDIVMNPMDLRSGWVDKSKYGGIISPSYYTLNANNSITDTSYFNYQFQRHYKERIFFPFGQGVSYDYRWGLGKETLLNFPIIVPPPSEQNQIVGFLDLKTKKIDKLIELTKQKIELLKEQRTALINQCVTKGLNPNVEMKDSGVEWIGEIPIHWNAVRLKYLVSFDAGYSFKSEHYSESGVNLIRIGSLYQNKLSLQRSPIFLPPTFLKEYSQFVIENGDILISLTGTLGKRDYGYSIMYCESFPSLLNQRVGRIRKNNGDVLWELMEYQLLDESFLNQLFSKPAGTKQGNLSSDDILGSYVCISPFDEQQDILAFLDEKTQKIDSTIEKESQRIKLLKEYRQALISEVVTGKIDVRNCNAL